MKIYKRPWNPMPGTGEDLQKKSDGTYEDVYIIEIGTCVVPGGSYTECLRKLPRALKKHFYCWLANKGCISRKRLRKLLNG